MTISSTSRKSGPYAGNDTATDFPFDFKVFSASDLLVVRADSTGAETELTLDTDFTVTLNANQDSNPGGTVTLPAVLATGFSLVISSALENLQPIDFTNQGGFYPNVINKALDRLTILVQQLTEAVSRSLKMAISTPPGVDSQLPAPAPYALIGWNAAGNGFQNTDPTYSTALATDLADKASTSKGARLVGWIRNAIGAVGRWLSDKLAETVSVKDFATVIGDGVADDTVGIAAAVAHCKLTGEHLYWPAGTYLTTANIPDFHSVRHVGPGIVKRGTDLFYVQPRSSQTNTIYLATTGGSANDGLSASQPVATFQQAFDILKNYGPVLGGIWNIVAAAGTWTINTGQQTHSTPSWNRVTIRGPVAGHPNVPTCIIDGTGGAAYAHGLSMSGLGVKATVRDIKFQNFTSGSTRIGLVGENESDLYTDNIHADNCDWCGIYAFNTVRARVAGGKLNACRSGFIANCTQATLGYGATNTSQGTVITNCTESGVYWSRSSQGHVDYCKFEDNAIGFLTAENSRCDTVGNDFKRNTVAIRARTGGVFGEGGAPNVFNNGTADANTTDIEYKAFSGNTGELASAESWIRVAYDRVTRSASGTTPTTLATPYTIKANRLKGTGKQCRVLVVGIWTTLTAGSTITVNFGGMAFTLTVPGAASNAAFEFDVTLYEVSGGYRAIGVLRQGLTQHRFGTVTAGFDGASDQAISVAVTMTGGSDAVSLYRTDVYLMG